ncbi:hypothetical protein D3C77_264600 [compost metagenome]
MTPIEIELNDEQVYALMALLERLTPGRVIQLLGEEGADDAKPASQALFLLEEALKFAEGMTDL